MQIAVVPAVAYGVALVRWGSRWGDQGWLSRQADAVEVAAYRGRLGERCDDAQAPSACATLTAQKPRLTGGNLRTNRECCDYAVFPLVVHT